MLKFGSFIWILLTILLLSFPVGIIVFFVSKNFFRTWRMMSQKLNEVKTLDKMRKDILQKRVEETQEETIWEGFDSKNGVDENITEGAENKVEGQTNNNSVSTQEDRVVNKEILIKQKKLLEKINYEALVLKKEGKIEQYEKKLIEGLAIDPSDKNLNQFLADLYFTMGSYNKALSLLKKIIEIDPQNHTAIWQLGEIYLITGDFETAELLVDKAINMSPSNPKYYISMVEIFYNTNRRRESINIMEKVVRLRPTNANYIYTLANLYEETGDLTNAKKYYFRVLECEPSNEKAKKKLKQLSDN